LFSGAVAAAEPEKKEDEPKAMVERLDRIDRALTRGISDVELLGEWLKQIDGDKARATACVPATEKTIEKLNKDLEALGVPGPKEPQEVARQRKTLGEERTAQENRLATCRVVIQRSDELTQKITALEQQLQAQHLLIRGPSALSLLKDERLSLDTLFAATGVFIRVHSGIDYLSASRLAGLALIVAAALLVGGLLRRSLVSWARRHRWHTNLSSQLGRSVVTTFAHYAPYLLSSLAVSIFFLAITWQARPIPYLSVLAYGLPPYFLALALIHVFLWPCPPAAAWLPVPPDIGKALARRLKVFALLTLLGYLLFASLLTHSLPDPVLFLARAVFAVVLFVNLAWAFWLLGHIPALAKTMWLRGGLVIVLLGLLVAELIGYRNLSIFAMRAVFGTLVAYGILWLATRLLWELHDGLDKGRHAWHRRLRTALALQPGDPVPGLLWARLIVTLFLWAVFVVWLLQIWGLPEALQQQLYNWAVNGITVGSLTVNPARIVLAIITLTVLLGFSGWLRSRVKRKWLPRTRMDRGAREATVTVGGYVAVALAVVIALAVSGFEFTNLAIIAGALSVGIGFGLQTIVNNFVSGLILLFERPIKTGDWIVVGNTEGYVKRIRIRSTEIQTFDRADVIVPNSDLISSQVTNWMLKDPRGRIRIPVSVAYGSDTEKVRDILLQLAAEHEEIIGDGSSPQPRVLFLAFGESSLDFELRCHIKNIDMRRIVISDINFAIDKAFRAHGIEIPFPQRDVHIRNWPAEKKEIPAKPRSTGPKR
jgi:small-conductance mechanosensitive channel